MTSDRGRIRRFRNRRRYIDGVLGLFERAGFDVSFVYDNEPSMRSWGAHLRPNEQIAQELGISYEILLWVDDFEQFQPRSIDRVRLALEAASPRLREDVAFLVSRDSGVADAVASLPSEATIIAFSIEQLRGFKSPTGPDFQRHLLSSVFARDPYRLTGAVVQPWQFFGRTRLISELVASVNSGHKIGLFGLRKIGKTSVLVRLMDQLRKSNTTIIVAHLQVARIDAVRRTCSYFLWSLGQAIFYAIRTTDGQFPFRLFGHYGVFSDMSGETIEHIPDLFVHDASIVLRKTTRRLCLVLDEIERMWPSIHETRTSAWLSEFPRVWQLIRSLEQEFPSRMSVVVAGTNPQCIESARIGDYENPLFQYIQIRYLPFLDREDAFTLLKDLGARAGLTWNDDACRAAYVQVAGHPALLRTLGSGVYEQGKGHERRMVISEAVVMSITAATVRNSNAILSEMCGSIKEGYPDDYMLLEYLAQNRLGDFRELSSGFPEATQHLEGFGLVSGALTHRPAVAFDLLQSYLQSVLKRKTTSHTEIVSLPEFVGPYQVSGSLGRAGGFGRVFQGRDTRSGYPQKAVAIKLLHSSSLSALYREVDIMKELDHQNIVKFLDAGSETVGNYLVMELLEGASWLSYCGIATRLRNRDAKEQFTKILKALEYLHPKRHSGEVASSSVQEILARSQGYVHRDIKPENIISVARRGPVLIDFGIASRAGDPTKTTTSTPGYLPPDFVFGRWDADVDLYQTGLTFIQVLVGDLLDGSAEKLANLKEVMQQDETIETRLKSVVLRMCSASRGERFQSASEALASL